MTTTDASRSSAAHHDPISLQIIRHELVAIPNQIEKNIERTAFSPLVQEYKDYSVGFVDPDGRLVAQSKGSLPIFVANALGAAVREGISVYGTDGLADGDIVISNTAEVLGQHLNNVAAYTPVRIGEDLVGFFAVLVHWIDVGGAVPGSCGSTTTTDVWQEGVQYPAVKLIERGTRREDIFRMIAVNSRFPKLLLGDLEAQLVVASWAATCWFRSRPGTVFRLFAQLSTRCGKMRTQQSAGCWRNSARYLHRRRASR